MNRIEEEKDHHFPPVLVPNELFVGRVQEFEELRLGLARTIAGKGGLFMIEGGAGIGKTRLAQELASYAEKDGVTVFWGRCYEDSGVPAYWPWIEIMRGFVAAQDNNSLRHMLGAGAGDVAEIVPEIREVLPDISSPKALASDEAQFRLFDSVKAFMKRMAVKTPLLLIIDNLHCSDRSSLRLLEILAQDIDSSCLLVVANCREVRSFPDHPLNETLGELSRHRHFRLIMLGALKQDETAQLLSGVPDFGSSRELVGAIHGRTGGNPLFVLEVMRFLVSHPSLPDVNNLGADGWLSTIPKAIRVVISKRLNGLSKNCNELLTVASVIGAEFGKNELERSSAKHSAGDVSNAVDEALSAWIIEEVITKEDRFRFTHVLIQEAIASQLAAAEREKLHSIIGRVLEELYADDLANHAVELANHFAEAGIMAKPEKSVHYFIMAGDNALSVYAYKESAQHFSTAISEKEALPMDSETASIMDRLSKALFLSGKRKKAVQYLIRAFNYFEAIGDVARAVDAVEIRYLPSFGMSWSVTGRAVYELQTRALTLVPPDSHEAGRLLCQLAQFHDFQNDYDSAGVILQQALDIGRREHDPSLQARVLANWAQMDVSNLRLDGARKKFIEAIDLARTAEDNYTERFALHQAGYGTLVQGNPIKARIIKDTMLELAATLRISLKPYHLVQSICQFTGDWENGRIAINYALDTNESDLTALQNLAIQAYEIGDLGTCEVMCEKMISRGRDTRRRVPPAQIRT
jgi:tetratricopeptide (TPR) repeat protein